MRCARPAPGVPRASAVPVRTSKEKPDCLMRVLLLTEGTYPYATGGVSTWCHELVHALEDVEFDLLALTNDPTLAPLSRCRPTSALRNVAMWGTRSAWETRPASRFASERRRLRAPGEVPAVLLSALRTLLRETLGAQHDDEALCARDRVPPPPLPRPGHGRAHALRGGLGARAQRAARPPARTPRCATATRPRDHARRGRRGPPLDRALAHAARRPAARDRRRARRDGRHVHARRGRRPARARRGLDALPSTASTCARSTSGSSAPRTASPASSCASGSPGA